jgi:hypothetical protein
MRGTTDPPSVTSSALADLIRRALAELARMAPKGGKQ